MPHDPKISLENTVQLRTTQSEVQSATTQGVKYTVDMEVAGCTCPVGQTGAPCKHQAAVLKKFGMTSSNYIPVSSPAERRKLHYHATEQYLQEAWFSC